MKGKFRKIGLAFLVLGMALANFQCNEAPDGFNASQGSTVEFVEGAWSIAFSGGGYSYVPATVRVLQDVGTLTDDTTVTTQEPANGVFVYVHCGLCDIFDRADGEPVTVPDPARIQQVSNPYTFSTDSDGLYRLVVRVPSPADVGLTEYTEHFNASIGVAVAVLDISATTAE